MTGASLARKLVEGTYTWAPLSSLVITLKYFFPSGLVSKKVSTTDFLGLTLTMTEKFVSILKLT